VDGNAFLPLIRRWALLLVVAAVAAGFVGYAAASRMSPTYESRARLLVGPLNTDIDTLRASGELTRTYAELATGAQVLDKAAAAMGGSVTSDDLRRSVQANANDVTRILTIRATGRAPTLAAKAADAVAQELIRLTSAAVTVPAPPAGTAPASPAATAAAPAAGLVTSVDPAEIPDGRVAPNVRVHVLLSMLAGTLMAMAIAFIIEAFGRSRAAVQRTAGGGSLSVTPPPATSSLARP
jgi:capsular polysaccharide biosynthesis protein